MRLEEAYKSFVVVEATRGKIVRLLSSFCCHPSTPVGVCFSVRGRAQAAEGFWSVGGVVECYSV